MKNNISAYIEWRDAADLEDRYRNVFLKRLRGQTIAAAVATLAAVIMTALAYFCLVDADFFVVIMACISAMFAFLLLVDWMRLSHFKKGRFRWRYGYIDELITPVMFKSADDRVYSMQGKMLQGAPIVVARYIDLSSFISNGDMAVRGEIEMIGSKK